MWWTAVGRVRAYERQYYFVVAGAASRRAEEVLECEGAADEETTRLRPTTYALYSTVW